MTPGSRPDRGALGNAIGAEWNESAEQVAPRTEKEGLLSRICGESWMHKLPGEPPCPDQPLGEPPAPEGPASTGVRIRALPPPLAGTLRALAHREGTRLFVVILAALKVLLRRLSGQDEVVVGTSIAGRQHPATEPRNGCFGSVIPLRTQCPGNPSFRDLLRQVHRTVLEARPHQALPVEKWTQGLHSDRDATRHPVFPVLFHVLDLDDPLPLLDGLVVSHCDRDEPEARFDLALCVRARPQEFHIEAMYAAHRFQEEAVTCLLEQLQQLLEHFASHEEAPILGASLVLPADSFRLPSLTRPLPAVPQPAIQERIELQARRSPQRIAIVDGNCRWTFEDLHRRSNQVAHHLLRSGLCRGEMVAVYASPSAHLPMALLGILKAGGVFLVLDATQPGARLRRMLDQARPAAFLHLEAAGDLSGPVQEIVSTSSLRCALALPSGLSPTVADTTPDLPLSGNDRAYVIFTSGSTGEPLGILGDHAPVSHFLSWHLERFRFLETDRFSFLSGPGHDPMLRDLFAPLWAGATLHIPPPGIRESPAKLRQWFHEEGITIAHLTPALAGILADPDSGDSSPLHRLRWLFIAGDRLTGSRVQALRRRAPAAGVVNFYGTSETPQAMAFHIVCHPGEGGDQPPLDPGAVPIGRPIEDVQLVLLNPAQQLAGVGELAEIGIRTPYLSRHYLNQSALTRERFVSNPLSRDPSDRIFRTGDLGRYRPDGSVDFGGRRDHQIKVRGYRVEPDEVARAIRSHPAVADCVVTQEGNGGTDASLVAHLVLHDSAPHPDRPAMRAFLKEFLPDAMVPARFFVVSRFFLTPNGKVDRRALSREVGAELRGTAIPTPPGTEEERQMLAIWGEILGRSDAGIHDNFFDLGGHSLLALRLVSLVNRRLGFDTNLATLFEHPTIAGLVSALSGAVRPPNIRPRALRGEGSGAPWFHVPGVYGYEFLSPSLARVIGRRHRFYDGLEYPGLHGETVPLTSVETIAAALIRQIEAVCAEGPLCLSGYSFGGTVAYEIARQMSGAGRSVAGVILFDTRLRAGSRRRPATDQVRTLIRRLREMPPLQRWPWLLSLARKKLAHHGRNAARRLGSAPRTLRERMEIAGWTANAAYRPGPYPGRVTLLRSTALGRHDAGAWERDPANGWAPVLHPGFEIRNLPCDHQHIFLEPVAPEVVETLEAMLAALSSSGAAE